MKTPLVSIIIPVLRVNYFVIFENLPAFEHSTYKNFEVIVLPNEHSPYDLELLKKYKWLRIIPTGKVTKPAEKRDMGVAEAKGAIVAFIDDDAYPQPPWLERAVKVFAEKKVEAVCGPGTLPPHADRWEVVFDEVLKTFIGSGGYQYRFAPGRAGYVDDYPSMNFLIKKDMFQKLGGFNTEYWPGEDSKLCNDLVRQGGKIYYDPSVSIFHHRRKEPLGFLKQHGQYGFHRGAFFAHGDANSRKITYLIPTLFTLYIILVIISSFLSIRLPFMLLPLQLYGLMLLWTICKAVFDTHSIFTALQAAFVLIFMHLTYGIMFVKGYLKALQKKTRIYD